VIVIVDQHGLPKLVITPYFNFAKAGDRTLVVKKTILANSQFSIFAQINIKIIPCPKLGTNKELVL